MSLKCTMILGDCLEVMPNLKDGSMNLCFADLPYGVTARNDWDTRIDLPLFLNRMWTFLDEKAVGVFTATASFAVELITALGSRFRYDLVWDKTRVTGFLNAQRAPLRRHEWVLVSCRQPPPYHAQRTPAPAGRVSGGQSVTSNTHTTCYGAAVNPKKYVYAKTRMPTSILTANYPASERGIHPSQKPLSLIDWIVRSYTVPGDTVFDPVAGSGTTAVSAMQNGRNVTCIEKNEGYFEASVERVKKHVKDNNLDVKIEVRR